ncbi:MAG: class I SAM-dependent methyltransferase [Chloroflexota bacterium]
MSGTTIMLTDELQDYFHQVSLRETAILKELREETYANTNSPGMQIAPEQGQFMQMLVKLIGAKRVIEVGVFTGYSSLSVALAMPEDGEILACDVNPDTTAVARRYWEKAGVAHKIRLQIGPATETLQQLLEGKLIDGNQAGSFDIAFIDADKSNYATYVDLCYQLVRQGGLLIVDNVLWHGAVIDPARQDEDTIAIRTLNSALQRDERFDLSLVPIGDGMTLLRKR